MTTAAPRSRKGAKIVAIASAAALAAVGGTLSIAAWTDAEWLTAGNALGDEGITTSAFEVQQFAYASDGSGTAAFADYETQDDANVVSFSVESLSPDVPTYGLVGLTSTATSIAGTVDLAVAVDGSADPVANAPLFDNTDVQVWTWTEADATPEFGCDADVATQPGVVALGGGDLGTFDVADTQAIEAEGANVQYYCFELVFTMPADGAQEDFMGLTLQPDWVFDSTSV